MIKRKKNNVNDIYIDDIQSNSAIYILLFVSPKKSLFTCLADENTSFKNVTAFVKLLLIHLIKS